MSQIQLHADMLQRTQLPGEKIDISIIKTLNNKLPPPLSDRSLLEIVLHNLNLEYAQAIKGLRVRTIEDLAEIGREEEHFNAHMSRLKSPPRRLLEDPELGGPILSSNNSGPSSYLQVSRALKYQSSSVVDSCGKTPNSEAKSSPLVSSRRDSRQCWDCRTKGHSYFVCRSKPTVFCHNCGKEEVFTLNCDCSPRRRYSSGEKHFTPRF